MDTTVQPSRMKNESTAMTDMIDRFDLNIKMIIMANREYETYNIFAHTEKKGMNYLIRVKNKNSNEMISSYDLPEEDEFDVDVSLILTKKQTNEIREQPKLYIGFPNIMLVINNHSVYAYRVICIYLISISF